MIQGWHSDLRIRTSFNIVIGLTSWERMARLPVNVCWTRTISPGDETITPPEQSDVSISSHKDRWKSESAPGDDTDSPPENMSTFSRRWQLIDDKHPQAMKPRLFRTEVKLFFFSLHFTFTKLQLPFSSYQNQKLQSEQISFVTFDIILKSASFLPF